MLKQIDTEPRHSGFRRNDGLSMRSSMTDY